MTSVRGFRLRRGRRGRYTSGSDCRSCETGRPGFHEDAPGEARRIASSSFQLQILLERSSVNWPLLLPLLVTATVAVAGWWTAHWLSTQRDRANKRRDIRVNYLIEAYRRLERASNRENSHLWAADLESAIADVQLFGGTRQVELAESFAREIASSNAALLDELLKELRDNLRAELALPMVGRKLLYLRIAPGEHRISESHYGPYVLKKNDE